MKMGSSLASFDILNVNIFGHTFLSLRKCPFYSVTLSTGYPVLSSLMKVPIVSTTNERMQMIARQNAKKRTLYAVVYVLQLNFESLYLQN